MRSHPLYRRCYNIRARVGRAPGYEHVSLWQPWRDDLTLMIKWCDGHLGPFGPGESIDRLDPFGDYVPGNLRKATPKQQAANKRRNCLERLLAELAGDGFELESAAPADSDMPPVPAVLAEDEHDQCLRHLGVCEQCPLRHGCEFFEQVNFTDEE